MLHGNTPFEQTLANAPDELFEWIDATKNNFLDKFKNIEEITKNDFEALTNNVGRENRKEIAKHIAKTKYPKLVFAMLDKKDHRTMIWKMLEPKKEAPFRLRKINLLI